MSSRFAYLSQGKLYISGENSAPVLFDSTFARGIRDRAFELQRRNAWKNRGDAEGKLISSAALWGASRNDPFQMRIDLNSVSPRGEGDGFVYSLISPEISGVLAFKEDTGAELRLLHTADYRVTQVASQPQTGRLAMSLRHQAGATIALMNGDGTALVEITQGESHDESPSWVPGKNHVVFQSAGIASNQHGQAVGNAPFSIQHLDLDSMQMSALLEDEKFDLLSPRLAADGTLYFIRRPYSLGAKPRSLWRWIEDLLLLPYRLIYALFQYLNFFTMMYTGKPLAQSGPFVRKEADQAKMMVWGNLLEAQKSLNGEAAGMNSMVPSSWELCRRSPDGAIEVLAKSVLSFDLESDGGILITNGFSVFRLSPAGAKIQIHKASLISQVVALAPATEDSGATTGTTAQPVSSENRA
jgi:hypothetical protein